MEVSWYGSRQVSLDLGGAFHSQRKRLVSSQVSSIPAAQRARWDFQRRKRLVFELLGDAAFDAHVTHRVAFAEAPGVYSRLEEISGSGLFCVLDYGRASL